MFNDKRLTELCKEKADIIDKQFLKVEGIGKDILAAEELLTRLCAKNFELLYLIGDQNIVLSWDWDTTRGVKAILVTIKEDNTEHETKTYKKNLKHMPTLFKLETMDALLDFVEYAIDSIK
jgi:hypothetical protein